MGKLSQDIIEQIPILYEELKTKTAVAKELGISVKSVTKYLLQENSIPGAKERKKAVKVTPEMESKINQRYQECCNMAQVAREFDVSNLSNGSRISNSIRLRFFEYRLNGFVVNPFKQNT